MPFEKRKSIRYLLNQTPFDGCLLLFNAPYNQVRQRASEIKMFSVSKIGDSFEGYCMRDANRLLNNRPCDLYVTIKGE